MLKISEFSNLLGPVWVSQCKTESDERGLLKDMFERILKSDDDKVNLCLNELRVNSFNYLNNQQLSNTLKDAIR